MPTMQVDENQLIEPKEEIAVQSVNVTTTTTTTTQKYEEMKTWMCSSTTLVYGNRASVSETENTLAKYELESQSEDTEVQQMIVKKRTEIEIVKESTRTINAIHTDLVAALETADQKRSTLKQSKCETTEDIEKLIEQYNVRTKIFYIKHTGSKKEIA